MGESPAEFHDILLSLEEEGLIESRFEAPSRLYSLKEKAFIGELCIHFCTEK